MSHDDHGHAAAHAPPPKPPEEITYFGRTNFRNQLIKFGIKKDDRRRHMYIVGKTGMGKSVLLENMFLSDIYAGHGCCYVDPHGDTAERLIDYIPSWRINDVVYFNPSDLAFPIGFNILEAVDERHKHLVASGMMGVFKKIWEDQWSSRMEYILNNTILALLDNPGSTLLGINRLLSDADYRTRIVSNVKDPVVKQFWLKEFASYNEKYAQEAVAPIQNKIGQFLSAAVIRNIVAQTKSTINIRELMDSEKIFIVNLSKGRIGEDSSRLLGGMLITKIQLAAMERVDTVEEHRKDFYLYVDEFQNFAVESFAGILSEARKYRLCLTLAHQYIAQLSDEVREAVFGNAGTIITFRVGSPDAVFLEKEFEPRIMMNDLINLPKYCIYLKLLIDGVASQPFSANTLPPIAQRTGSEAKVTKVTHERYALPRADIEDKILKWSGVEEGPEGVAKLLDEAAAKKKAVKDAKKPKFEYTCTRCGKQIILPVELDKSRPIYCEDCIEIVRASKGAKPPAAPVATAVAHETVAKPVAPVAAVRTENRDPSHHPLTPPPAGGELAHGHQSTAPVAKPVVPATPAPSHAPQIPRSDASLGMTKGNRSLPPLKPHVRPSDPSSRTPLDDKRGTSNAHAKKPRDLPSFKSGKPVERTSHAPSLTLAELSAKAGVRSSDDDDETGPAESDLPEIPVADLAARAAAVKSAIMSSVKTGTLKPGETATFE